MAEDRAFRQRIQRIMEDYLMNRMEDYLGTRRKFVVAVKVVGSTHRGTAVPVESSVSCSDIDVMVGVNIKMEADKKHARDLEFRISQEFKDLCYRLGCGLASQLEHELHVTISHRWQTHSYGIEIPGPGGCTVSVDVVFVFGAHTPGEQGPLTREHGLRGLDRARPPKLGIPDFNDMTYFWTNPFRYSMVFKAARKLHPKLIPLVLELKWWNYKVGKPFPSFLLERLLRAFVMSNVPEYSLKFTKDSGLKMGT